MTNTTALVDANQALGRRFFAEQDRLRGGPAADLCTTDYTATLGGNPAMPLAGHQGFAQGFYAAFPDAEHTVEQTIATADRVAVRFVIRGTHTGSFFGIPASGRSIVVAAHALMHVADGRVDKLFGIFDEAGLLRQIGALPG